MAPPTQEQLQHQVTSPSTRNELLQLIFQGKEPPKKPGSNGPRPIDEEMDAHYLCRVEATSIAHEAGSEEAAKAMCIRQIKQNDPYDSLEGESGMEDDYQAACSRKHKELEAKRNKSKNKKKGSSSQETDPKQRSTSAEMDPSRTVWAGPKPDLTPFEGATKLRTFCPIPSVAKFPYKYIDKDNSERVSDKFFNEGKFWGRTIDVYYIHPPSDISTKPILLMPVSQVEKLIAEIGRAFRCELGLPPYAEESGFCVTFFDDGTPQPRFLGTSTSQGHFKEMESRIPPPLVADFGPPHQGKAQADRSFEAFRQKMMLAVEVTKKRSKAVKDKKKQNRIATHLGWFMQLKRSQRYLGLRAHIVKDVPVPNVEDDWEEYKKQHEEHLFATNQKLLPLDVFKPAPYPIEKEVVFVCIDVESNERAHSQITEIGISTLDTLDLVDLPPGEGGKNWMKQIRSRHFRIVEHSHVVNKDFVHGCADKFEYGTSEWISLANATKAIDSCFKFPYSAGFVFDQSKSRYLDVEDQDMIDAHKQPVVDTDTDNKPSSSEADVSSITTIDEDGIENKRIEDDAIKTQVIGNAAVNDTEGEDNSGLNSVETHAYPTTYKPTENPIPNFNMASLIAARKELAARVHADPSILDDPSPQAPISITARQAKEPIEMKIDQFLTGPPTIGAATTQNGMKAAEHPPRPLILLGHDTKSDISYLRLLGYDPASQNATLLEALDTASMYKVLKRNSNSPKLGAILVDLGLTGWHLHNAGNDARYTLESMIGILIKARRVEDNDGKDPDDPQFKPDVAMSDQQGAQQRSEIDAQITKAAEEAKLRVIEEYDTWASLPGLAPYIPTTNPATTNLKIPGLAPKSQYSFPNPPVAYFTDEHPSLAPSRQYTFPTDIFPTYAIDGGDPVPIDGPPPAVEPTHLTTGANKFHPGYMDKEAMDAELSKQVEFDWENGITIDGKPPVESAFQKKLREREEREAKVALEMVDVEREWGRDVDANTNAEGDVPMDDREVETLVEIGAEGETDSHEPVLIP